MRACGRCPRKLRFLPALWRIRLGCFYKNKKRPKGRLLFLAAPTGLSDSHVRFHSMGPFRYVRLKLRWHLFSPTDAPNLRFSSRWKQAKLKPTTRVGCNFGSPNIAPRYAINKIKKISLGRFFKIFLIVYSRIRHAQLGLLWRIRLGCFYKNKNHQKVVLIFGSPTRI